MTQFTIHDKNTAPAGSQPLLENSVKTFGMIPNLHGVMAEAPQLLEAYQHLHDLFQKTSFNADELTVVWQSINVEHGCHYCVPAHTGIAHSMNVDAELIDALNNRQPLPSPKLQALQDVVLSVVRDRGHVNDKALSAFYEAGYGQQQLLEIILGVAQKVVSNYTNHVADTPVDAAFAKYIK